MCQQKEMLEQELELAEAKAMQLLTGKSQQPRRLQDLVFVLESKLWEERIFQLSFMYWRFRLS